MSVLQCQATPKYLYNVTSLIFLNESCSVKLHLPSYIVCNLSAFISSCTTILSTFLLVLRLASAVALGVKAQACFPYHLSNTFETSHWPTCLLPLQLLACAALADCLPSAITWQAKKNTQEDTTDHITCFLLNSSMITSVLPLARDRDDGTQMLQTMFRCHMSTVSP